MRVCSIFLLLFIGAYIVKAQCGSCPAGTAPNAGKEWLGTVDSDWENPSNWSGGTLPTTNRIEINPNNYTGNAVNPIITVPSTFTPNDVVITDGGILTISNTLIISDDFTIWGDGSTLNITAGSNASGDDTNLCRGGTLNVSGGSFDNTSGSGILRICTSNPTAATNDPSVNVTGGTVNTNDTAAGTGNTDASTGNESDFVNVSGGGTYDDPTDATLPVELLSFEAYVDGSQVVLRWSTAVEINNSHFDIERSEDATNFEVIGIVGGHGTTEQVQTYTFTDYKPFESGYYRLKQVDYDGKFERFATVLVAFGERPDYSLRLPGTMNEQVQFISGVPMSVRLMDASGRELRRATTTDFNVSTSAFRKGIYFLQIEDAKGFAKTTKFYVY